MAWKAMDVDPESQEAYELAVQGILSELLENRHFSGAYNLWPTRLDKFWTNNNFC